MIQIVPQMRILVAVEPVDFRNGIDGLVRICKQKLSSDPFGGWLFVFANRRRTAIKILAYDQQGFWCCQKRLSTGQFRYWPSGQELRKHWKRTNCNCCWWAGIRPWRKPRRPGDASR